MKRIFGTSLIALVLLAGGTFSPADAAARDWRYVAQGASGARFYVDVNSWTYPDPTNFPGEIDYWERSTGTRKLTSGRIFTTLLQHNRIDCASDTETFGPSTWYDSRGRVVKSDNTWEDWSDIVPGSVGESIRDYVCSDYDS